MSDNPSEKIKVLIVTNPLNVGGFDIVAMNLQKNLPKTEFECTYCIHGSSEGIFEKSVIEDGAAVIHQPDNRCGYIKSYFYYKELFSRYHFDVVHSHLMFYSGIVMRAAYKSGIKKRVAHSHMTDPCFEHRSLPKRAAAYLYSLVMKRWLNKYSTDMIACGPEAGDYLYGKRNFRKNGILLNNGTYTKKFRFSNSVRSEVRKELGIADGTVVVGHIGRLNYVKNHKFLIDIFNAVQKIEKNSVLLIVGDGEQRENIERKIKELKLEDKVIFTGIRKDVDRLVMAIDVFVFPSLHEGFPMTLVEAQASKLPCVISDSVSPSAKINDNVCFVSLSETPERWAQKSLELAKGNRESVDTLYLEKNFDLKCVAEKLAKIYKNGVR